MDSPVRAWQEWEEGELTGTDENWEQDRYVLTAKQMQEAVTSWNNRSKEMIHEPVDGQISMEEAIQAGEHWFTAMGIGKDSTQEDNTAVYSVNSILSIGKQKDNTSIQQEPYYSFWTVRFSSQVMSTVLYINAVTGQVWGAEITWYQDVSKKQLYEKLEIFVETAGLHPADKAETEINDQGTQAVLAVKNSLLYARIRYSDMTLDKNSIVDYNSSGIVHDKYAVITYDFKANEE